jgi:hypothetical protein
MYNISQMDAELSTLGTLIYSGFAGEGEDRYLIVIENFIDNDENVASFYSITGKYLIDFECVWFSVELGVLKSQLNKI